MVSRIQDNKMKHCTNKKRAQKAWTAVPISGHSDTIKRWCQHNGTAGRFTLGGYWDNNAYFENAEDALVVKLKWGRNIR